MSFLVNDIEPKRITFQDYNVTKIYYNGTYVWGAREWPGIEEATLADVRMLCENKKQGIITEWPEDIVVGATINVSFPRDCLLEGKHGGAYYTTYVNRDIPARIIGIDFDYENSITFELTELLWNMQDSYTLTQFDRSQYNPLNKLAKGVSKKDCYKDFASDPEYTMEWYGNVFWPLSPAEMGVHIDGFPDLYPNGKSEPYPYYVTHNTPEDRIKKGPVNSSYLAPMKYLLRGYTYVTEEGNIEVIPSWRDYQSDWTWTSGTQLGSAYGFIISA